MSIRRMSLGAGYRYLMSSVARADGSGHAASALTRYYAESGTPPGRFLGRGLAGLDNGSGVAVGSPVSEEHLFRMLGMLQDPVTGEQLGRSPRRGGTAYIDSRGVTRKAPLPVAGFDLTFSAPKSVSVAWAVADETTLGLTGVGDPLQEASELNQVFECGLDHCVQVVLDDSWLLVLY